MGRFSDKVKIVYLLLVILFAGGVLVYLLDTWGVIKLEERFPFLQSKPPIVSQSDDSPTLLEIERLRKEKERLEDVDTQLKERSASLEEKEKEVKKREEELKQLRQGLAEERKKIAEERKAEADRKALVETMAGRLGNMPPNDAVAIVAGWSNSDLVDVFREMERVATAEGRTSIVPFLMTKLPRERAQVVTTLMMDSDANRVPTPR